WRRRGSLARATRGVPGGWPRTGGQSGSVSWEDPFEGGETVGPGGPFIDALPQERAQRFMQGDCLVEHGARILLVGSDGDEVLVLAVERQVLAGAADERHLVGGA